MESTKKSVESRTNFLLNSSRPLTTHNTMSLSRCASSLKWKFYDVFFLHAVYVAFFQIEFKVKISNEIEMKIKTKPLWIAYMQFITSN
jgi:hypothetical protein